MPIRKHILDRIWWAMLNLWDLIVILILELATSKPAIRRCRDVATTPFCMSQRRCRYVSNETPNSVLVERRQCVSVIRLRDILLESCTKVSRGRNNDVPSVSLQDISNKSQMKHQTTSQWYVTKTSQWYVSTTSHSQSYVFAMPC